MKHKAKGKTQSKKIVQFRKAMNFKNWKQHQSRKALLRFKELRVAEKKEPQKQDKIIFQKNMLEFGRKSNLGIAT